MNTIWWTNQKKNKIIKDKIARISIEFAADSSVSMACNEYQVFQRLCLLEHPSKFLE
jgi:hypothetical protein